MYKARLRYAELTGGRSQFLDTARECSRLTLPYLIKDDDSGETHKNLPTPWQSVGAKTVTTLTSKLLLALLPPQTTFFKLQVRDDKLGTELPAEIRSEMELSFSKMERMVMDYINASNDRVVLNQALKHLVVGGNALLFMHKEGLKCFPLNRYVVNRDGDGNVCEIVTKELIARKLLGFPMPEPKPNAVGNDGINSNSKDDDVEVYTYVRMDEKSGRWTWHQEIEDKIVPNSRSTAPKSASPWLVLRFASVDGEDYGRGRVEEFLGDFKSLEALSQALVEGSAVAAKVIFTVSPSSTTKPQTLTNAPNGAIVAGRPDDIACITTGGKTADFRTAADMALQIEKRLQDAFLVFAARDSERTTSTEVQYTQLQLEQQLGGLFSLMTDEFLKPYLARTLMVLQRSGQLPKIPKDYVRPQIVAGINALGRGQDAQQLVQFITTIAQTMGPEAIQKFIDPTEYLKRLAAAQGIDVLNLIKTPETLQQDKQMMMQEGMQRSLVDQAGQLAGAPLMDPSKNPELNGQDNPPETQEANTDGAGTDLPQG
jgi:hypothetical protein|tara:strand:- start:2600 stop:4222 length:1623 start_codon:yes stop_codon:yes gene_type:complete